MAHHDFICPGCGHVLTDVNIPIAIGATAGAPSCPEDGRRMEWIPQIGRMDAYEPFQEFDTYDGRNRPVHIDSLTKLRQVERESERMAANGEGQPMIWRRFSQDHSNRDVPTLGKWDGPAERPDPAFVKKHGPAMKSATEPDVAYGPGVSDANASPLDALTPLKD